MRVEGYRNGVIERQMERKRGGREIQRWRDKQKDRGGKMRVEG